LIKNYIFASDFYFFKNSLIMKFLLKKCLALATIAISTLPIWSQGRKQLIDNDWKFHKGELTAEASENSYDDSEWRIVNLPHDWSIEGAPSADEPSGNDGGYRPTGKGWYRKTIDIAKTDAVKTGESENKRWFLYFEGVYMDAEVFINGKSLGTHHYGYSSFIHDITNQIKTGQNTIAVSVDNSKQKNCRWYTGSGIYRHVWLICTDEVYFKHWGTFITTPSIKADMAEINISTDISNASKQDRHIEILTKLIDKNGNEVGKGKKSLSIKPGETTNIAQSVNIHNPQMWSPETPSLYKAELTIMENGKNKDRITETF
jgi:beta-galactosidase